MQDLFFIIDTACNRACQYCFYETGHLERTPVTMTEADWLKLVDDAAQGGIENIILTGGEPLAGGEKRIDMIENILKRINYQGINSLLITNGELLTVEVARRLVAAGLKMISISLDTLTGIRGYKVGGWKAVEASLKAGLRVNLIMAITRENYPDIPAIYRFAARRGLGLILQPAYIPADNPRFEELSLESMQMSHQQSIVDAIIQWADDVGVTDYPAYIKTLLYRPKGDRPGKCHMGRMAAVVDCDGTFLPCFHRRDLQAGSVKKEPFYSLMARMKEIGKYAEDANCWGMHCLSLFTGS
jgi:MoaA/NifB/PqqE/SkfB family radical SAM enzyme